MAQRWVRKTIAEIKREVQYTCMIMRRPRVQGNLVSLLLSIRSALASCNESPLPAQRYPRQKLLAGDVYGPESQYHEQWQSILLCARDAFGYLESLQER